MARMVLGRRCLYPRHLRYRRLKRPWYGGGKGDRHSPQYETSDSRDQLRRRESPALEMPLRRESTGKSLGGADGKPVTDRNETRNTVTERSEEHTSELQSQSNLVCRLLLEKK